jgi:hypothetical protein
MRRPRKNSVAAERAAAVAFVEAEAEAVKSGAGIDVPPETLSYARQRLLACAAGMAAGLHVGDPGEGVAHG